MFGLFGKKDRAIQTYKNNINASMGPLRKAVEKVAKDIFRDYHRDIDEETFSLALHTFIFWGFCRNLQRVCKLEDNQIDEVMSDAHKSIISLYHKKTLRKIMFQTLTNFGLKA
jgi:hypothetical protein